MKHHPEYHGIRLAKARGIIRKHYNLNRAPSDSEIRAEIDMIRRIRAKGLGFHDDKLALLAAALDA